MHWYEINSIETIDSPALVIYQERILENIRLLKQMVNNKLDRLRPHVKTNKIAFDKCKFGSNILEDINQINPGIEKLQVISCDLVGDLTFSQLKNLKELHLVYTLDSLLDMKEALLNLNLDKLVISGDLASDKESKEFISDIRSKGTKVEIVGPKI